jgi:hypothetical protein
LVQRKAEGNFESARNIDPIEVSRGDTGLREDQTAARETHEHRRNRDKTAHRFPAQREKGDKNRANQRRKWNDPRQK